MTYKDELLTAFRDGWIVSEESLEQAQHVIDAWVHLPTEASGRLKQEAAVDSELTKLIALALDDAHAEGVRSAKAEAQLLRMLNRPPQPQQP